MEQCYKLTKEILFKKHRDPNWMEKLNKLVFDIIDSNISIINFIFQFIVNKTMFHSQTNV